MLCEHLWVSGSFKHFSLTSWTHKFCWGTPSRKCNLLVMAHGVHPLSSCYLLISLLKAGQKFDVTLLNRGRWWWVQLLFFLRHAQRTSCSLIFGGGWSTKVCTLGPPWIEALYFIEKVCDNSVIFGILVGMFFLGWMEERIKFSLVEIIITLWVKLLELCGFFYERMLIQLGAQPTSHEWVG